MRDTLLRMLITTLLASGLLTCTATAADAVGKKNCVTKREWQTTHLGMDLASVQAILGARGKLRFTADGTDGSGLREFQYKQCGKTFRASKMFYTFETTESEVWVCDEPDAEPDAEPDPCVDGRYPGHRETRFSQPFVLTEKASYYLSEAN